MVDNFVKISKGLCYLGIFGVLVTSCIVMIDLSKAAVIMGIDKKINDSILLEEI